MSFSVADLITALYPELNATSSADLCFWDSDALYAWAAESVRKAALTGMFADHDTTIPLAGATSVYNNPVNHNELLRLVAAGALLRRATAAELAAYSDTWEADSGPPARWIADYRGHDLFYVYPTPTAGAALEVVLSRFPADVMATSPTVAAPQTFGDYLSTRMIAEARRQDGDGAMPEVADALDQEAAVYEQLFDAFWGQP